VGVLVWGKDKKNIKPNRRRIGGKKKSSFVFKRKRGGFGGRGPAEHGKLVRKLRKKKKGNTGRREKNQAGNTFWEDEEYARTRGG